MRKESSKSNSGELIVSVSEYQYLKSLEDAIKHPERYLSKDSDYPTPMEIISAFEAIQNSTDTDSGEFMELEEFIKNSDVNEYKI
ncbi:MAG: hypothetical protein SGI89_05575 [bacterium]|nr:hypothetical protein [bacterium]